MAKIGVGIMGLGMGRSMFGIQQVSNTDLEIRGICDTNVERLEKARTEYDVPFATTDYRELIQRDEIEVVGIYTPDPLHAQHCLEALDCGKHVICTKGFVDNLDDAMRILQRTRETGLKLLVGQTSRFVPNFMHTHRLAESGRLGRIVAVETHYVHDMRSVLTATPWRYQMPQKLLYGGLCHPMDLMIWFLGFPQAVHTIAHESRIDDRYPSGEGHFNDNWMVNLIYNNGQLGRVLGLYGLCHPPMGMLGLSVYGTAGSVVNGQAIFDTDHHKTIPVAEAIESDTDAIADVGHIGEVVRYMLHFEDCLKGDKQPLINAEVGAKVIAVLDACERSAKSGKIEQVKKVES
ncbi:Gfo/Idh/MocA family oxidoreductase [Candidatus Poribacteria bacterium]|nr:Gfo/Idh/MocA family oxidoreductase [Candidatus Poribacteria bacterium]